MSALAVQPPVVIGWWTTPPPPNAVTDTLPHLKAGCDAWPKAAVPADFHNTAIAAAGKIRAAFDPSAFVVTWNSVINLVVGLGMVAIALAGLVWCTAPLISGLGAVAKEGTRWALRAGGRGGRAVLARVQ
jgi:hypothetical protein